MATPENVRSAKCGIVVLDVFSEMMKDLLKHRKITAEKVYDIVMNDVNFLPKLRDKEKDLLRTLRSDGFMKLDALIIYKIAINFKGTQFIPQPTTRWGERPLPNNIDIGDDAERINIARNEFAQIPNGAASELEFEEFFNVFLEVGQRVDYFLGKKPEFGHAKRIRDLKTTTLDTETVEKYQKLCQELGQQKHDSTNPSQNNEFLENELPMDGLLPPPPPLPSRRENHDSKDGSPRIDSAPKIPPRGLPPPVPPRKDLMFGSLTRCQSVSQQPTRHLSGHFQNLNATLPRCSAMERKSRPSIPVSSGKDSMFDSLTRCQSVSQQPMRHLSGHFQNLDATFPRCSSTAMALKELRPTITVQEGKQNFFRR
ncbi:unnamed protein product [Mytilus coruscus]|uniref:Uncharacterized protein n=1 Tax=Mytilus coruscus TaxID=42192 RepID=A0A6J8C5K3_MYTCO|nr:unnamed protein product [Mytilus coruscus]